MREDESGRARDEETGVFVSKLTDEVIDRLEQALRAGTPPAYAAPFAGISRSTYHQWLKEGRREGASPELRRLIEVVERAIASYVTGAQTRLTAAGKLDWRADAFSLERRFPEEYGRRDRVDHGNADGQPFKILNGKIDLSVLTRAELEQWIELHRTAEQRMIESGGEVVDLDERRAAIQGGDQ